MGEKVYGYHAIEEALKKAGMGSTLYLQRNGGDRLQNLEREAMLTGKVAVKKLGKEELSRMMEGVDLRGALLDLGGPRRGASRLKETTVDEFCSSLGEDDKALVLILDGNPPFCGPVRGRSGAYPGETCRTGQRDSCKSFVGSCSIRPSRSGYKPHPGDKDPQG